ncbi:MAG TPA: substrate-binding domain-containing protein, partial [Bdellovibrionales bacterium]|nr:substrate-binding domain-containing protein [Bdellovibrionales bacterium]
MKLFAFLLALFTATQVYAADKIKIGFVLSTLQEERYQKDQKFFKDEAAKLGFEPVLVSAENNEQTQTAKVENLLSMGVKALIIQPVNSNAAGALVKEAHADKVPVIAYDRMINDAQVDYYVTMDSFSVGKLQAEEAVKHTGGKGNFIILMGQAGHSVANEITRGVESVLSKHPGIKVVVKQSHEGWKPDLAMATVENALTQYNNKIDAILANNSGMAQGAVQALSEQKLAGKVFVAGADADLSAIKNIVAGRQHFEVLKDIEPLARTAAQVAFKLAKGEKPKPDTTVTSGKFTIPTMTTPVYPITKSNLEQRIFATGFHS